MDLGSTRCEAVEPERKGVRIIPSRVIATSFALVSFATAAVVGLYVGNDIFTVVGRAAIIMFVCYLVGLVIGRVAQWTVDDHIVRYQEANPIPQEDDAESRSAASEPRAAA